MTAPLLKVTDATKTFGSMRAVDNASFEVATGSITGLIGPNGAGKSTLFGAIAGENGLTSGSVVFNGEDIASLSATDIYARGLSRTFQIPRPFPTMTVLENVMLAATGQIGERFWNTWFRPGAVARQEREIRERAAEVIQFCNLTAVERNLAGAISGGQKKLLELARVLMSDPKLILLDEPAAGVNPALLDTLVEKIVELNARGKTFLIIEHNMDMVMSLCDPIVVLAQGKVICAGTPEDVANNSAVIDAYLGEVVA
ncbi:ABC transporter ATP-binding protein [Psychromarinibacter sp. S121]|uniref:ABC transporter ATP-binding protein n=1 Tax=Psychromarinibacter sp. S121 TaxID=3415127 RepID=UPI003C7EB135